jgi:hypothetical protein
MGVPWQRVDGFLSQYQFDSRGTNEIGSVRQYLQAQAQQDELVEWSVALIGLSTQDAILGVEPAFSIGGLPINRIGRTRLRIPPHSIGSLVNPATVEGGIGSGDEEIGLTEDQLREAHREADQVVGGFPVALRRKRSPRQGLLLLYPISPYSRPRRAGGRRVPLFDDPARDGCTVLGIAMVFPMSATAATIEYVVGSVCGVAEDQE